MYTVHKTFAPFEIGVWRELKNGVENGGVKIRHGDGGARPHHASVRVHVRPKKPVIGKADQHQPKPSVAAAPLPSRRGRRRRSRPQARSRREMMEVLARQWPTCPPQASGQGREEAYLVVASVVSFCVQALRTLMTRWTARRPRDLLPGESVSAAAPTSALFRFGRRRAWLRLREERSARASIRARETRRSSSPVSRHGRASCSERLDRFQPGPFPHSEGIFRLSY